MHDEVTLSTRALSFFHKVQNILFFFRKFFRFFIFGNFGLSSANVPYIITAVVEVLHHYNTAIDLGHMNVFMIPDTYRRTIYCTYGTFTMLCYLRGLVLLLD